MPCIGTVDHLDNLLYLPTMFVITNTIRNAEMRKNMKVVKIIFSPTGGTEKAVNAIAQHWGMDAVKIDLSDAGADFSKCKIDKEDIVLTAMPSFGGHAPAIAIERLKKIDGNGARCVLVCVYGNRAYEDTLVEMEDAAKECGFQVAAAIAAVAEHSIIHQYAAGRPDKKDMQELSGFAKKIYEKLMTNELPASALKIPGSRPYKKTGMAGLVPKAVKGCVGCGLCAENCPVQAISKENLKTADSKKCISCMRCVAGCPKSARKVNGVMVSVAALAIKKACLERKNNELFILF